MADLNFSFSLNRRSVIPITSFYLTLLANVTMFHKYIKNFFFFKELLMLSKLPTTTDNPMSSSIRIKAIFLYPFGKMEYTNVDSLRGGMLDLMHCITLCN
jgi:hypothetical protein